LASIPGDKTLNLLNDAVSKNIAGAETARLLAIGFSRADRHAAIVLQALSSITGQTTTALTYALWASGELARIGRLDVIPIMREAADDSRGIVRGYARLGLAKAGQIGERELLLAADHATEYIEVLLLGIAGLYLYNGTLIGRGILATQSNHAPVWRLQGHLLRDLCAGLATGGGLPGKLLLRLLSRGDLD
jgi:hypothetical protein